MTTKRAWRTSRRGVISAALGSVLCAGLTPLPAAASFAPVNAFVWADQPAAASYVPNQRYQRTGFLDQYITISRLGVGSYAVDIPEHGTFPGHVQVTAYGYDDEHCKVASWSSLGSAARVEVLCFTGSGVSVDAAYTLTYVSAFLTTSDGWFGPLGGYVWANSPTISQYAPSAYYQWNTTGQANTIRRLRTGEYEVTFPGVSSSGGNAQVTAYGYGNESCLVRSVSGRTDARVRVQCIDPSGRSVDTYFNASFEAAGATSLRYGAFALVRGGRARETGSSSGGAVTASRVARGFYTVTFQGFSGDQGSVTVSAAQKGRCKVVGWYSFPWRVEADVACFDAANRPQNRNFSIRYIH